MIQVEKIVFLAELPKANYQVGHKKGTIRRLTNCPMNYNQLVFYFVISTNFGLLK
jgi:hypothetical protein